MPNQKHSLDWELSIGGCGVDDDLATILVTFEGEIESYVPMIAPDLNQPGEPPEGGYAILTDATFTVKLDQPGQASGLDPAQMHVTYDMSWLLDTLPQKELDSIAEHLYDDWEATKGLGE